jgi:hypothetical protein
LGAVVVTQVAPESAEVHIGPLLATTTNLVPSAEAATQVQFALGASLFVQVIPESAEV